MREMVMPEVLQMTLIAAEHDHLFEALKFLPWTS
jgi:hypothetical protein